VPAIFGSEVFPSKVLQKIAAETNMQYIKTLRDDDLPGEPGAPEHSYLGMMRANVHTMVNALGGNPAAFESCNATLMDKKE
jgi:ABC-type Zn uptake system ZnuABC Zn-binding protein ZnuA